MEKTLKMLGLYIFSLLFCVTLFASCKNKGSNNTSNTSFAESESTSTEETSSVHQHNFTKWVITKSPTCMETGVQEGTCACGEKVIQQLPLAKHKFGE